MKLAGKLGLPSALASMQSSERRDQQIGHVEPSYATRDALDSQGGGTDRQLAEHKKSKHASTKEEKKDTKPAMTRKGGTDFVV